MMRDDQLPEGVPASNTEKPTTIKREATSFAAPDMATPSFARKEPFAHNTASETMRNNDTVAAHRILRGAAEVQTAESASSIAQKARRSKVFSARQTVLFAGILVLLGALGAGVMLNRSGPLPLCAEQPDWNQYNCRAI